MKRQRSFPLGAGLLALAVTLASVPMWAQEAETPMTPADLKTAIDQVQTNANILWTVVSAALVFWMQAGFAMVEAGFTRAKKAANIMMKNLMDASLGASSTGRSGSV